MAPAKVYKFDEVSKHTKNSDIWLIIHGKVYDVTTFMDDHPGGSEALLVVAGYDATDDFEETGHSENAKTVMAKYYVGDVDVATVPKVKRLHLASGVEERNDEFEKPSQFWGKIWKLILPFLILGMALAFRSYYSNKE